MGAASSEKNSNPGSRSSSFKQKIRLPQKLSGSFSKSADPDEETDASPRSNSGLGYMDKFGFNKDSCQKDLEEEENRIFLLFRKKLKVWAYFAIWFSAYILLNVCIEFSSAPFYELKIDCYLYHTTAKCQDLKDKTKNLYLSELFYGIMMIT